MDRPYDFGERSFRFGVAIVAFCRLVARRDPILRRIAHQLVDSGTSIGANLSEGVSAQSKAGFINKQCIALKESREKLLLKVDDNLSAMAWSRDGRLALARGTGTSDVVLIARARNP